MAKIEKSQYKKIKKMYTEGNTMSDIAKYFKVPLDAIVYAMRKAKIPRRSMSMVQKIRFIKKPASFQIRKINNEKSKKILIAGLMLYWAEGHKEKEYRPGTGVQFTNSDPQMIRLFLNWLDKNCGIKASEITFSIYIHENSKNRSELLREYWAGITGFKKDDFLQLYFKKGNIKTLRKNVGNSYFGVLRVKVKASSVLQRKIAGWIKGVVDYFY